jgi:hypothetical protein
VTNQNVLEFREKKGLVHPPAQEQSVEFKSRLMLTCLGGHVESSPDFVFQKLYIQIIRR